MKMIIAKRNGKRAETQNAKGQRAVPACAVAICAVLAFALAGCSSGGTTVVTVPAEHVITVNASSEVKVEPDMARVGVSVTTQGADAASVQAENGQRVDAVMRALRDAGVEDASVQTSYAYLNPIYGSVSADVVLDGNDLAEEFEDDGDAAFGEYADDLGDSAIVGYEMTTRLQVGDLPIDNVGAVLQACVAAGASGTDGPEYYASDYDAAYQQALDAAIDAAHAKAQDMAKASGVKLGGAVQITEGYQDTTYRYAKDSGVMLETVSADAAYSIAPGQVSIEATVTASYAIG